MKGFIFCISHTKTMKKFILLFIVIFFAALAFSQTVFQGKVIHKFITERDNETGTVEVFYGNLKIKGVKKITPPVKGIEINDDVLIIDFSKGVSYHVNPVTKTYRADSLKNKRPNAFPALVKDSRKNTKILNQSCSAFVLDTTAKNAGAFIKNMDFLFWYADSLNFPIDEQYINSDDLGMFTNGKTIGMGLTVTLDLNQNKKTLSLIPISVEPMQLPDSLFEIPRDYILETNPTRYSTDDTLNAAMSKIDSAVNPPKVPREPKKKTPLKPAQKKVSVNSSATGRKE